MDEHLCTFLLEIPLGTPEQRLLGQNSPLPVLVNAGRGNKCINEEDSCWFISRNYYVTLDCVVM